MQIEQTLAQRHVFSVRSVLSAALLYVLCLPLKPHEGVCWVTGDHGHVPSSPDRSLVVNQKNCCHLNDQSYPLPRLYSSWTPAQIAKKENHRSPNKKIRFR